MDGARSGDAVKDKVWVLQQRLAKHWSSYDLAIYTDGPVKDGSETGGGGILVTTDYQSDHSNHHSYAIPVGTGK